MSDLALLIALWNVAIGATIFCSVYHALARWWQSPMGVNIMMLVASLAAVSVALLVNIWLDRPDWMRWVFVGILATIGSAIWWRLALLVKAQRPRNPRS